MIIKVDEEVAKKNEINERTLIAYSNKLDSLYVLKKGFELEYLGDKFPESKCFGVKRIDFKMSYPEYCFLRNRENKSARDEEINKVVQNRAFEYQKEGAKQLICENFYIYARIEKNSAGIGFEYGKGFLVDEKDLNLGLELILKENIKSFDEETPRILDFILQHL